MSILLVGGLVMLLGDGWGPALTLALFVCFWGGIGFGSMLGGVMWLTRAIEASSPHHAPGAVPVGGSVAATDAGNPVGADDPAIPLPPALAADPVDVPPLVGR